MRRAIEQRKATIREVKRFAGEGLIGESEAAEIEGRLSSHVEAEEPMLSYEALCVLDLWLAVGSPCTVFQGLSMAVVDERARLFGPRLEMLRLAGVENEAIEIYLRWWAALDDELIAVERKSVADALKRD